jgi:hypothetical protein
LYRTTKKVNERRNFKKRMKEFGSRSVLPSTFKNCFLKELVSLVDYTYSGQENTQLSLKIDSGVGHK